MRGQGWGRTVDAMRDETTKLKAIARRVWPGLREFDATGFSVISHGPGDAAWDVRLVSDDGYAWLCVYLGHSLDCLYGLEVRGDVLKAMYALPAVFERADGEKTWGTCWARSRLYALGSWDRVVEAATAAHSFFDNRNEWLAEDRAVWRLLES